MKKPPLAADAAGAALPAQCICPACAGPVTRIGRRAYDRFINLFKPVYRYRCDNFNCRWVGNLSSAQALTGTGRASGARYRKGALL